MQILTKIHQQRNLELIFVLNHDYKSFMNSRKAKTFYKCHGQTRGWLIWWRSGAHMCDTRQGPHLTWKVTSKSWGTWLIWCVTCNFLDWRFGSPYCVVRIPMIWGGMLIFSRQCWGRTSTGASRSRPPCLGRKPVLGSVPPRWEGKVGNPARLLSTASPALQQGT